MKKYIFVVISLFISFSANAQQTIPSEFFGLKYGNTYSLEEIISHVGDNGRYIKTDDPIEFSSRSSHIFYDVTYNGREYPYMCVFLASNVFDGVMFKFSNDNIPENQSLESIFDELSRDLSNKYTLTEWSNPLVEILSKGYVDENGNKVTLSYAKWDRGDEVMVSYSSSTFFATSIADYFNNVLPTIQDTFFGLKMGSRQTTLTIRSAVGAKGTFLSEKNDIYGKTITFKDITFAGKRWNFGDFSLTESGELYHLNICISLADYSLDNLKEANLTYETFKSKLTDKYGEAEEKTDDEGKYVSYIGDNSIGLILSNKRSKSERGSYRRYVILEYWQTEILSRLNNQSNDEL